MYQTIFVKSSSPSAFHRTIIYCIGLIGSDGLDIAALNNWETDPDATHVAVTPDAADLEELFAELAANISKAGATDIVIKEKLTDDFEIVDVDPPAKGTAIITGVFILFQYGWMHGSYGVNIVGMVVILLGYSLVLFTGQLTAMTIYCLTSGSDKKRRVAPVGIRGADYPP